MWVDFFVVRAACIGPDVSLSWAQRRWMWLVSVCGGTKPGGHRRNKARYELPGSWERRCSFASSCTHSTERYGSVSIGAHKQ